jgi:hypothetical protein
MCNTLPIFPYLRISFSWKYIHLSNTPPQINRSYQAYRVSGIPRTAQESDVQKAIEGLVGPGVKIVTLSLAPSSGFPSRHQTATVTFDQVPSVLSGATTSPPVEIPQKVTINNQEFELRFDNHFHGLTPLNNPNNPKVE